MKRRLRHGLVILAVLLAAAAWLHAQWASDEPAVSPFDDPAVPTRVRNVFVLDGQDATTFRLPARAKNIRIASRAVLDVQEPGVLDPDTEFFYAIDYHIETLTGRAVSEGTLELRARMTPKVAADGVPAREAWLSADNSAIADLRASILDVDAAEVLVLKLRAGIQTLPVIHTLVRVAYRQEIPERKLAYRWDRLSPKNRARLLENRLLGGIDLRLQEKQRMLQLVWSPVGPQGVSDRDYIQRALYQRDDLEPLRRPLIEPLAIGEGRCGPGQHLVLGIPAPGGTLALRFRYTAAPQATSLTLRWFGETIHDRGEFEIPVAPGQLDAQLPVGPGMVEFISPVPLAVTPWLETGKDSAVLLAHKASVVRAWTSTPDYPLPYTLVPDASGHVRVVARPLNDRPANLVVTWKDSAGTILSEQPVALPVVPSLYDRQLTPDGDIPAAEPVDTIQRIPRGAAQLELRTDVPAVIAAYIRPAGLLHRTRVPADYLRALPDPDRQPVWISWKPDTSDDLLRSHRSVVLHQQTRPPEDDTDILAGKFQWEDFQPAVGSLGHLLLTERNPEAPGREDALSAAFMSFPINQEQELPLATPTGVEQPARRLIFVRAQSQPARLQVFIDGQLHLDRPLVTARGELLFPALPPDTRTMRWQCSDPNTVLFLNYMDLGQASRLKRLAQRMPLREPLIYLIEKKTPEQELLTGTYYGPDTASGSVDIHLILQPETHPGFLDTSETFTPRSRMFQLDPDRTGNTPVLGGSDLTLDRGRRFFIPLGVDLAPGTYRLQLTLQEGADGYLTLSRILGGDYADARFFRESSR